MKRKYRVYSEFYLEVNKTDDPDLDYDEAHEVAADKLVEGFLDHWDLEEVK